MNPTILKYVIPLVGKVKLEGFDASKVGNKLSLQVKIQKHVMARNAESLMKYLAFCIQEWPKIDNCPVDRVLIGQAITVIKEVHEVPKSSETHVDGRVIPAGCKAVAGPGGRVGVFDPSTGRSTY